MYNIKTYFQGQIVASSLTQFELFLQNINATVFKSNVFILISAM